MANGVIKRNNPEMDNIEEGSRIFFIDNSNVNKNGFKIILPSQAYLSISALVIGRYGMYSLYIANNSSGNIQTAVINPMANYNETLAISYDNNSVSVTSNNSYNNFRIEVYRAHQDRVITLRQLEVQQILAT